MKKVMAFLFFFVSAPSARCADFPSDGFVVDVSAISANFLKGAALYRNAHSCLEFADDSKSIFAAFPTQNPMSGQMGGSPLLYELNHQGELMRIPDGEVLSVLKSRCMKLYRWYYAFENLGKRIGSWSLPMDSSADGKYIFIDKCTPSKDGASLTRYSKRGDAWVVDYFVTDHCNKFASSGYSGLSADERWYIAYGFRSVNLISTSNGSVKEFEFELRPREEFESECARYSKDVSGRTLLKMGVGENAYHVAVDKSLKKVIAASSGVYFYTCNFSDGRERFDYFRYDSPFRKGSDGKLSEVWYCSDVYFVGSGRYACWEGRVYDESGELKQGLRVVDTLDGGVVWSYEGRWLSCSRCIRISSDDKKISYITDMEKVGPYRPFHYLVVEDFKPDSKKPSGPNLKKIPEPKNIRTKKGT